MRLFGGIEGGGTKFVCAVADERLNILSETVLPTQSPEQTVEAIAAFFNGQQKQLGPVAAYGVGSFGPLRRDTAGQHFVGAPFGGWKDSGLGGEECLEELYSYSRLKAVHVPA